MKESLIKEDLKINRKKFPLIIKGIFDILASGIALAVLLLLLVLLPPVIVFYLKRPGLYL